MIYITLGSQKFQFNRLLKAIDELIEKGVITEDVFAQIGYSDYLPKNYKYKPFVDRDEFAEMTKKADVIITHGGTGAIIGAVKQGKKVIAVPRLAQYGEHVDNHQRQLVGQFADMDLISKCDDCSEIGNILDETRNRTFKTYESNTNRIIESIEDFILNG